MDLCTACSWSPGALDPLDKKWQKNLENEPDKETEWEERPIDRDHWFMSNNALRNEIKDLQTSIDTLVERGELQMWEAGIIRQAWAQHKEHVLSNLENKDKVLRPFLEERINLSPVTTELATLLDALDAHLASLDASSELKEMMEALERYKTELLKHYYNEESTDYVLMRAYFTPDELQPIVSRFLSLTPGVGVGSLIFYAGYATFFEFMNQQGISTLEWYWNLKSSRHRFERNFVQPLEAVQQGAPQVSCGFC